MDNNVSQLWIGFCMGSSKLGACKFKFAARSHPTLAKVRSKKFSKVSWMNEAVDTVIN